jgi:hypothetical protein
MKAEEHDRAEVVEETKAQKAFHTPLAGDTNSIETIRKTDAETGLDLVSVQTSRLLHLLTVS